MSQSIKIGSRFTIPDIERDLLGRGGIGEVYRALNTQTGETVAIKALHPDVLKRDPSLLERFLREGEALRQLNHPNIVRMIAALEENGCHYLVMEYLPGGSLQDVLAASGKLPHNRVIQIALDLADALTRAHRLGIIHRDLKPANVLLAEDGTPRLADFGIAHLADVSQLTQSGIVMGTIDYLSPEACRGEAPDERSDIWSFGVLLFQMLSGQKPFQGDSMVAKLNAILTQKIPDLGQLAPNAPVALIDLVYRMLEKDPQQRIPSVRLVGAEMESILKEREPVTPSYSASAERRFATPVSANDGPNHNLPVQSTRFVGREAELVELGRLLADQNVRLVTILGVGGMGKTRLALEAGARQLEHFQHGVYFVALGGVQAVEEIETATVQALGFSFYEGREPRQQLLDYLREKKMLLIFDNFEHLLGGKSLVGDILHAASNVELLSTSRVRLGLPEEHLFHLSGMDFPTWEPPADALEYSAVKLFLQSARRVRPGFELASEDLTCVARICRLVGGMPLGILLAAAWLELLTPAEVASEIQNSLDFLAMDTPGVDERQRSIRAVLDYSWNLLTEREQDIFQKLSVFLGGFTREAVQTITGASLHDLMGLVNKSLLVRAPSGRYEIHEFLRQYAAEKLAQSLHAEQAAQDHHCAYYAEFLHQREIHFFGKNEMSALAEIGTEIENVRKSWDWAVTRSRIEDIDCSLEALARFYDMNARYRDGEATFSRAIKALEKGDLQAEGANLSLLQARLMIRYGNFCDTLGDSKEGKQILLKSLAICQDLQARKETAIALYYLGQNTMVTSVEESSRFFHESLSIFQEIDDSWGIAVSIEGLGSATLRQGDHEDAKRKLTESLRLQRELGNHSGTIGSLCILGYACWILGEYNEAKQLHSEALGMCREIGDRHGIARSLDFLAIDSFGLKDYEGARRLYLESLAIARDLGEAWRDADILSDLGELAISQGEYAKAQDYAQESLSQFQIIGERYGSSWSLRVLGNAACGLGNFEEARRYFLKALSLTITSGVNAHLLHTLVGVAKFLAAQGDQSKALEVLTLVIFHKWSWQFIKDLAAPMINKLVAELPPDVTASAQARGRSRDLEITVHELLVELGSNEVEHIS